MVAANVVTFSTAPAFMSAERRLVLVDPDRSSSALLARYLESRGWSVQLVDDARRAIRQWGATVGAPYLLLNIGDDEPDPFELLGALAARALTARVIVVGALSLSDARLVGVERALPARPRFSLIASVLEQLEHASTLPEVS